MGQAALDRCEGLMPSLAPRRAHLIVQSKNAYIVDFIAIASISTLRSNPSATRSLGVGAVSHRCGQLRLEKEQQLSYKPQMQIFAWLATKGGNKKLMSKAVLVRKSSIIEIFAAIY